MKKLVLALFASACVLSAAMPVEVRLAADAMPVGAQAKIKIAIMDFENHAETSWWFFRDMGPAARNHIDTAFSENSLLSAKFSVIERTALDKVLKEQGLAQAGAVDPQSAAKVGKILGVRYIVTGGIDKFAINTTRAGLGGIGGSQTVADAVINLRFIDSTTAERVISIAENGQIKKGGMRIGSANLSRDAEWGIASEAIEKASKAIVEKLVLPANMARISDAAGSTGGIDLRVARVDGTRAYINAGVTGGLKVGDKVAIFRMGPDIVDPVTGAKLGAEEKQVGTGVVTDVQAAFSIMNVTGTAAVKDVIKKQ